MQKIFYIVRIACVLAIFLLFVRTDLFSQNPSLAQPIPASPNAASLGVYGQVPVSLFSGLPQVSIPLGEVRAGDISVPISLNYHGGGIRPDIHSSWVGLGWDLDAGGVITRKLNASPDEMKSFALADTNLFSYYYKYYKGDNSLWPSVDTLVTYFGYTPGSTTTPIYPSPDEFVFNFGKYSGSFYYNTKGQWQVKSNDPVKINVKEQIKWNFNIPSQINGQSGGINLARIFYQFTLTTPDGMKYTFGGTPESIEFTRSAGPPAVTDGTYNTVVPTSWYLTNITSRNGQQINFIYQRSQQDGIQCMLSSFINLSVYSITGHTGVYNYDVSDVANSIINPSYLTTIKAPNQTINFARSTSTELAYNYTADGSLEGGLTYPDLSRQGLHDSDITGEIKWFKLDSISFYSDSTGFLKKFGFNYTQNTSTRLVLNTVSETGMAGFSLPPYQFTYDATALPAYNSQMLDHWGYYNGHNFFVDSPVSLNMYTVNRVAGYTKYRNSNPTYAKAGTLTAIKYPTGGITTFAWEPHDFSKVVKQVVTTIGPGLQQLYYAVTDTSTNASTGGLRIRQITNTDSLGHILTSKLYYYRRNYSGGSTTSSGVLAGVPRYIDSASNLSTQPKTWLFGSSILTYWFWHDYMTDALSFTDGNHVTYSEVTEKLADSSYTVNTFSNQDQGTYLNKPPVGGLYLTPYQWQMDGGNNMSLDRGKLLTKSDYTSLGKLLRRVKYDYDTAASRLSQYVKQVKLTSLNFGGCNTGRITAYLEYTFPQYMIRQTDSLWDQNGLNPMVTISNMRYDTLYRSKITDSTINSVGDTVTLNYLHPQDMLSGPDSAIYKTMRDSNMIQPVIVEKRIYNRTQTNYTKTNYYAPYTGIYAPQSVNVQIMANPAETRLNFYNYDTKGNLQSASKTNDSRTSYIWDYKQTMPVAEIKNASPSDIAYTSFESDSTVGYWTFNANHIVKVNGLPLSPPPTGFKYYQVTGTYKVTRSGLNAGTTYVVSYWTRKGSPFSITGTIGGYPITGKTVAGWTYYEHKVTGQSTITLGDSAAIDELRLYPQAALMSTYTYDPVVGMTSSCDVNNRITYYLYDDFSRLQLVKDQDWNVIKKICYGYSGLPQGCATLINYGNQADSITLYRNNCIPDSSASGWVTYVVPAGTYHAYKSQAYADSLAHADVLANGQAYANAHGICVPPPPSTIVYTNTLGKIVRISMTNNASGINYAFVLNAHTTVQATAGTVPSGTYTVNMGANGTSTQYTFAGYVQNTPDTDLDVPAAIVVPGQVLATAK